MEKEEIIIQLQKAQKIIDLCVAELGATAIKLPRSVKKVPATSVPKQGVPDMDFGLNERNFIKTHASGMGGPKKFVLLLARMTQGKTDTDIEVSAIAAKWNKMTSKDLLLGYSFNAKYATVAKTEGWIDSRKYGTYHLRKTWKDIFLNS